MEAELITAAGDGLGPALLLTLPERLRPQYLFNVPEGFSRFALEHKIRPGLGLRATFIADLASATGLPGLIMRLRGEGHGQVEVLGPPGTLPFVSSLRHFVHWRHPAVLVAEIAPLGATMASNRGQKAGGSGAMSVPEVYADEHVAAVALWTGGGGAGLPAEWLAHGQPAGQETSPSSSEEESGPDTSSSSTNSDDSTSSSSGSDDSSSESSSSDSDSPPPQARDESMFAALDEAFAATNGARARAQALGLLGRQPAAPAAAPGAALAAVLAQVASAGDAETRTVLGRVYRKCDAHGVSVFARERQGEARAAAAPPRSPPRLLGYALLIRASQQVLVVSNCYNQGELEELEAHPALQALRDLPPTR